MDIDKARELRDAGQSYREIAAELGVSKSLVAKKLTEQPVTKGYLNPRWTTVQGGDPAPVDIYGAIPAPSAAALLKANEDSVYFCTDWIAKNVAKQPLKVLVQTRPGQKAPRCLTVPAVLKSQTLQRIAKAADVREVVDHPLVELLEHPNPEMSRFDFLYYIDSQLSLIGDAFVHMQRDGTLPCYLWPLLTQFVELVMDKGQIAGYKYTLGNEPRFYPRDDVIHIKLQSMENPYATGYSPVRAVYERILLGKYELGYLNSLFRNQARPDSIIQIKGGIQASEVERLQKEMSMRFRQGGIGGPWVIDADDMDVQNLNWSPKDVLGTEIYKWTKLQIINAFSLNPALFDTESSNRAVATEARRQSQSEAVEPRLRLIEHAFNHQLVPAFDERLLLEFECPVEADLELDQQRFCAYATAGIMTINEIRKEMGLPPVAWGDKPYTPSKPQSDSPPAMGAE